MNPMNQTKYEKKNKTSPTAILETLEISKARMFF